MTAERVPDQGPLSQFEQLRYAREIIQVEGQAVLRLMQRLDGEFCRAVELLHDCPGSAIVSGIGKAGLIAQKIAATLASTGTRSQYLHPAEAIHGDLGRVHRSDVIIILSQSGETEEVLRMLASLVALEVPLIAITGNPQSTLGRSATVTIDLGPMQEACRLGLAPSTSTTAMLAMGDALALVVSRMRGFGSEDFARFHPGGSLGRKLSKVDEHMRPLHECRVAKCSQSVRDILIARNYPGRRTGAVMVVDCNGKLRGIFTDSDLARLFESRRDDALDGSIRDVMTSHPAQVPTGSMMSDAVQIMAERKISELPVVDAAGQPAGLIDITDVVNMLPDPGVFELLPPKARQSVVPPPKHLSMHPRNGSQTHT